LEICDSARRAANRVVQLLATPARCAVHRCASRLRNLLDLAVMESSADECPRHLSRPGWKRRASWSCGTRNRSRERHVELSQSLSDMPRGARGLGPLATMDHALSLHDTREFMLSSGSDSGDPRRDTSRASH